MKLIRNGNEFILKYGGETILEYSKDRPMIYAGRGKEDVDMYRGNYKIEDYVTTRRPLSVTDTRETQEGMILNLTASKSLHHDTCRKSDNRELNQGI